MRSGFRPDDRDRTTESMEGSLLGFGPLWMGCWAANKRGFYGYPLEYQTTSKWHET